MRDLVLGACLAMVGCAAPAPAPAPATATASASASASVDIVGEWTGCDGRVVTLAAEDGMIVGRYTALGGLERFGFTVGEVGYRLQPATEPGVYTGDVKWRFEDGRTEWRRSEIRVDGDELTDSAGDTCGGTMTRVGPG